MPVVAAMPGLLAAAIVALAEAVSLVMWEALMPSAERVPADSQDVPLLLGITDGAQRLGGVRSAGSAATIPVSVSAFVLIRTTATTAGVDIVAMAATTVIRT